VELDDLRDELKPEYRCFVNLLLEELEKITRLELTLCVSMRRELGFATSEADFVARSLAIAAGQRKLAEDALKRLLGEEPVSDPADSDMGETG